MSPPVPKQPGDTDEAVTNSNVTLPQLVRKESYEVERCLSPSWREVDSDENERALSPSAATRFIRQYSRGIRSTLSNTGRALSPETSSANLNDARAAGLHYLSAGSSVTTRMSSAVTLSNRALLRVAPLGAIMEGMGSVLSGSAGTPEGHAKSFPSPNGQIDDFLSHNWTTGRWAKYFALALHYNIVRAITLSWVVGFITAGLTAQGWLPVMDVQSHWGEGKWCCNSSVLGVLTLALVMCFNTRVFQIFPTWRSMLRQPLVFFDKLCIDQQDEEAKARGIRGLAAFLKASRRMVIVYSDNYLHRLWTIYELASFLTLHHDCSRIDVASVDKLWRLLAVFVLMLLYTLVYFVVTLIPQQYEFQDRLTTPFVCFVPFWILSMPTMRRWMRDVHRMKLSVQAFRVRDAVCFSEDDRSLIYANIAVFMTYLGKVPLGASQDEALDEFDRFVTTEMPAAIQRSMGRQCISYVDITALGTCFLLHGLDLAVVASLDNRESAEILHSVLEGLCFVVVLVPLLSFVMGKALSFKFHLEGWAEVRYVVLVTVFLWPLLCLLGSPVFVARMLLERYGEASLACGILGAYFGCCALPTWWLYWPVKGGWIQSEEVCLAKMRLEILHSEEQSQYTDSVVLKVSALATEPDQADHVFVDCTMGSIEGSKEHYDDGPEWSPENADLHLKSRKVHMNI